MLATLPMHALPEVQFVNDALWHGLAERLAAAGVPAQCAVHSTTSPQIRR